MAHSDFKIEWLVSEDRVFFDIGCFDGTDSIRVKQAVPDLTVHAFECNPVGYTHTALRLAGYGIKCEFMALCDVDGVTDFHANRDGAQEQGASGSILAPTDRLKEEHPHLVFSAPIKVPSFRLDTYCRINKVYPDVIHMDVQGAEFHVLSGMGHEVRPRLIFLEVLEVERGHYAGAKAVHGLLENLGYSVAWSSSHDQLFIRL